MLHLLHERLVMDGVITFAVRVRPHAPRHRIVARMEDGSIKVDLAAPAEDGKANRTLLTFLADAFSVPVSHVRILAGETGRRKLVKIVGG